MRSAELDLNRYDSDKINNRYLERYDPVFHPLVEKKIVLLELGVHRGGSLLLWRDYFPHATIVGVDIALPKEFAPSERIHLYEGSQSDRKFLSRVAGEMAPEGFDIIIDDASHMGELTKAGFWHLFDHHLRPNGLYVIEDWGTGYWNDWVDGESLDVDPARQADSEPRSWWLRVRGKVGLKVPMPCHSYGMVGFVKQLVDEQAAADVTRKRLTGMPTRSSRFSSLTITPSIVFVRKAAAKVAG